MPIWMLISDFLHDLKANKTRVFLTTLAVIWGTQAIVLMMAFGRGFSTRVKSAMLNGGNNIIRVWGGQTGRKYKGQPIGRWINFKEEDAALLQANIPGIQDASPVYGRNGVQLRAGNNTATTYTEGVYPNFEYLRTMYPKAGGRFLNDIDLQQKRRVVYLGSEIAEELFGAESPIGKTVELDGIPFVLVGVMQTKMQMGMSNGPDSRRAIIPFTTYETLYPHRYIRMITVRPKDVNNSPMIQKQIRAVLARKLRFDPADEDAMSMWDMISNLKEMSMIFVGIEMFLGFMGGLTLLIAGVGIANIMYVVVKERTKEIGVKLAIGARPRHIVAQFVFEALLITGVGGLIGILFSWGIVTVAGMIPPPNEGLAYLGTPEISQSVVIITVSVLSAIGLMAGLFPAKKAAKLDPVESLRYE